MTDPTSADPLDYTRFNVIVRDVTRGVREAITNHAAMNSPHEGISLLREAFEELWAQVKMDTGRSPEARKAAEQIAAMAIRYIYDLGERDR